MLKSDNFAQSANAGSRENPEALLQALVSVATHLMLAQVDAFSGRLSNALLAHSESAHDSREASLSFGAGQLIKKKYLRLLLSGVCRAGKSLPPRNRCITRKSSRCSQQCI